MIEFDGAGFSYGRSVVLQDVTFSLTPGTFHVLYGEPGVGKSTLLRLCRLDMAPTSGRIRFFGGAANPRDRDSIADLRRALGVLETDVALLDHLSLAANIALPLVASGADTTGREQDIHALLEWVDLGGLADARPPELTRAERQCAALARALILSPALILADDPTAGLGWGDADRLLGLLADLNQMGKAVVLATHDPAVVEAVADRTTIRLLHLADGTVTEPGEEAGQIDGVAAEPAGQEAHP